METGHLDRVLIDHGAANIIGRGDGVGAFFRIFPGLL